MRTEDIATRLARLDACAAADALDQLGLAAAATGLLPLAAKRRMSGRVITVTLRAGNSPADARGGRGCNRRLGRRHSSGAAFIPAARIEAVIAAAEKIAAKEAALTRAVLAGRPVSQVMGAAYEHRLRGQ